MGTATATGVGGSTLPPDTALVDKVAAAVTQCARRCSLCSSANRSLSTLARSLLGGGDDCSAASIEAILASSRWQRSLVGGTVVDVDVLGVDVLDELEVLDVEDVVLLVLEVVEDNVVVVVEAAVVVVVAAVSVNVFESLFPAVASIAVIVSGPGVVEAVRCVNAPPVSLVVT